MIFRAGITAWRSQVPWSDDAQVEQDLVLSRARVDIFSEATLSTQLALRGGTAFNKLVLESPARYSEDIDLVQDPTVAMQLVLETLIARLPDAGTGRS
ncbi:MAG: nucleotidyl transferase AbiEii/AbiGii toxin family protein [Candidatus Xenobia bacterium]